MLVDDKEVGDFIGPKPEGVVHLRHAIPSEPRVKLRIDGPSGPLALDIGSYPHFSAYGDQQRGLARENKPIEMDVSADPNWVKYNTYYLYVDEPKQPLKLKVGAADVLIDPRSALSSFGAVAVAIPDHRTPLAVAVDGENVGELPVSHDALLDTTGQRCYVLASAVYTTTGGDGAILEKHQGKRLYPLKQHPTYVLSDPPRTITSRERVEVAYALLRSVCGGKPGPRHSR